MLITNCKIILVAIVAVFFTLVAFSNVTDYYTNFYFVQHILSMDSVMADSKTTWRAITSEPLQHLFYGGIVAWEILSAIICWIAAIRLFLARQNPALFKQRKGLGVLGLTSGFSVYAFGFLTIAAEWFQMWQSEYNATAPAGVFLTMIGFVILILLAPDE